MSADTVPLGFADLSVPTGSHIGYPYRSEEERFGNLLDFMCAGLSRGEKCITAIPEYSADYVNDGLLTRGIQRPDLPDGQIEILTAEKLFRDSAARNVRAAVDTFGATMKSSLEEGFAGVRGYTGFSYIYSHREAIRDLLAAECETNDCIRDAPLTVLCSFSREEMHPKLLDACLQCHPFLTNGASFDVNDAYMNPDDFGERLSDTMDRLERQGAFVPPFAALDFHCGIPVIRACPELDFYTCEKLDDLANRMMALDHRRLIVDLSGTTYIDASSIGTLLGIAKALSDRGGELSVVDSTAPPRKIFRIVGLEEQIPIYSRLEEAAAPVCA